MKIVIIDDEPVSLAVMKQLVAKLPDCQTHEFTSASAAYSWCIGHEPDLVIVDYMMPIVDGIEFTRRLRGLANRQKTPVVLVSAAGDREMIKRALASGVTDFLSKPFDFVELQNCVTNTLGIRAMEGQLASKALLIEARAAETEARSEYKPMRLLDRNISRARLGGDEKLLSEVARIFIHTVPDVLSSVRAALLEDDFDTALTQVVSIKGAVAAVEAPDVLEFLGRLEKLVRNRDLSASLAAFAMVQALAERLLRELAPVLPQAPEQETNENEAAPAPHKAS